MPGFFYGGIHPDGHKELSRDRAVEPFPTPAQVVIPMSQHIGVPCKPLVRVGDYVTVGQKIGDNEGLCSPVHSSVSGTVKKLAPFPNQNGTLVMGALIENDGLSALCPDCKPRENVEGLTPAELISIIREAGIVGMGGASFPTHFKLSSGLGQVDTIVVNAAECEPYITADDRLLREEPERFLKGLRIVMKIFGQDRAFVGIEANKPEAIAAVKQHAGEGITVVTLRTRYPQGAEKQLIQAVTGRQVPSGKLPSNVGCAVFNAATCAAICDAVYDGMPSVSRILTVTGPGVERPANYKVAIGTPFSALLEAAGLKENPYKIISGGPMMGMAQYDLEVPVGKGCNCILVLDQKERVSVDTPHCIRCGKCVSVCPMRLQPLFLYKYERMNDYEKLSKLHVMDCMECGSCAYICPAKIPLVQSVRTAKSEIRIMAQKAKVKEAPKA